MRDIYKTLCRIGSERADLAFDPKLSAAYTLERDPFDLDLLPLLSLENMEFIETLYMALLNRTIEEKARNAWEQKQNWPKEKFQAAAINTLLSSAEYRRHNVHVRNNIYAKSMQHAAIVLPIETGLTLRQRAWKWIKPSVKRGLEAVGLLKKKKKMRTRFDS